MTVFNMWRGKFESSVNSEGIETFLSVISSFSLFESSVNSEGIETLSLSWDFPLLFESSVNSEGIETLSYLNQYILRLRVV